MNSQISSKNAFFKEFNVRNKTSTGVGLLAALGLTACGGGGSSTPVTVIETQQPDDGSELPSLADPEIDEQVIDENGDIILGSGGIGGLGGGSATSVNLTLSRSGTDYVSSSVSGFTLLGTDSHYQVANSTSDAYNVKLTASGEGMLTFEFTDADDVVTLSSGSSISGFTQLKVIRGTVDVTNANTSGLTYISVASSVKLTAAQVLDLDAIVISAASGGVEVEVQSQAEIDQITEAMTNGSLNLFSAADNLLSLTPTTNTVTQDAITSAITAFNTEKKLVSEIDQNAIVTIEYSNGGLTTAERATEKIVNIFPADGQSVVSAKIDGIDVGSINSNFFRYDFSLLESGFHTLSVTTQSASGVQSVTQEEFFVVGTSNSGADIFEFETSKVGDIVTVEAYVKNLHADFLDGIRSYDYWIDLDHSKFEYIEGSFSPVIGSINFGAENQPNGEIFANGIFEAPWSSYDDALFSFQARDLLNSNEMAISFVDLNIYRTDLGDFSISVDI